MNGFEFLKEIDDGGLDVEYYVPNCNGNAREMRIHNIYEDDRKFILENNLKLTLEELPTGMFCAYLRQNDEDEDEEVLTLSRGRTCQETIKELVMLFKKKKVQSKC
jgi:hypothetical protein